MLTFFALACDGDTWAVEFARGAKALLSLNHYNSISNSNTLAPK